MKFGRWKYQKVRSEPAATLAMIPTYLHNGCCRIVQQAKSGATRAPLPFGPMCRSDLFFEYGSAARFADLVDISLHFPRRLLAQKADNIDHQEPKRHSQ